MDDPALASAGERIYLRGTTDVPACAMCHSRNGMPMMGNGMMGMMGGGMGMMAEVPRLEGQHAAYILSQLHEFSTGERRGMMMNRVAAALSPTDAKAVAAYLSGQR